MAIPYTLCKLCLDIFHWLVSSSKLLRLAFRPASEKPSKLMIYPIYFCSEHNLLRMSVSSVFTFKVGNIDFQKKKQSQKRALFLIYAKTELFFGPSGETRTPGILLPKQARYQLRYTRIFGFHMDTPKYLNTVAPNTGQGIYTNPPTHIILPIYSAKSRGFSALSQHSFVPARDTAKTNQKMHMTRG